MSTTLIHERMLAGLTDFFPSFCTIEVATSTTTDSGHVTKRWAAAPDMAGVSVSDIRCNVKPIRASEARTADLVVTNNGFRIGLLGFYPLITTTHRAVVDNANIYNILGVEHDSQHLLTTLTAELVTV